VPLALDLPKDLSRLDAWWNDKSPEQRREVVRGMIAAVVMTRVGRGQQYEMGDVTTIEWRRHGPSVTGL
jgi:hypothetical protein